MSKVVNVCGAQTKLSELLNAVENGEDVAIARAEHPVARLIGIEVVKDTCGLAQTLLILSPRSRTLLQAMTLVSGFLLDTHTLLRWVQGTLKEPAVIWDHATATKNLPHHHGNPFDRVIIAQAQLENCSLITRNAKMSQYDIHIISA